MGWETARTQKFLGLFGGLWDKGEIDETKDRCEPDGIPKTLITK